MNRYNWLGVNRQGERLSGEIQATTRDLVKEKLYQQGIIPKKITKKWGKTTIKPTEITRFTRQLSNLLEAGLPLLQAFDIILKGQTHVGICFLINELKQDLASGIRLADAFRKQPAYFNALYCNLVSAGEASGTLETMLTTLVIYREKIESIKRKIKKAFFYPAIVMAVGGGVCLVFMRFVVPQFESLFKALGGELPVFTQMVIHLSNAIQTHGYKLIGLLTALSIGTFFIYQRSLKLKRVILSIPVIGPLLRHAAIARFAKTLSITCRAGLPLYDALALVSGATGHSLYAHATRQIQQSILTGQSVEQAMRQTQLFPMMMIQLVSIGEASGMLEHMFSQSAAFYETEVDTTLDTLSTLIEPVMICALGIVIGGLVIAMYLPIFQLGAIV